MGLLLVLGPSTLKYVLAGPSLSYQVTSLLHVCFDVFLLVFVCLDVNCTMLYLQALLHSL